MTLTNERPPVIPWCMWCQREGCTALPTVVACRGGQESSEGDIDDFYQHARACDSQRGWSSIILPLDLNLPQNRRSPTHQQTSSWLLLCRLPITAIAPVLQYH